MAIISLESFTEMAGSQQMAAQLLGCTQPAVATGIKNGNVFVDIEDGEVKTAFTKRPFPDVRMKRIRKTKTSKVS